MLLLVVCLAAAGAVAIAADKAAHLETFLPGVTVRGVELTGMTPAEASGILQKMGAELYDGLTVTAQLPLDNELTVSAWDAGLAYTDEAAVEAAWNYGRDGTLLENAWTWIRAEYLGKTDFTYEEPRTVTLNEDAVRQIVAGAAADINEQLLASGVEVTDAEIRLTKGASGLTLDQDEIVSRFKAALLSGSGEGFTYEAAPQADEEYDFRSLYDELYSEVAEAKLYYARDYGPDGQALTQGAEPLPEGFDFAGQPYGISRSAVGVTFDVADAEARWKAASYGDTVVVPLAVTKPEMSTEDWENMLFADNLSKNWTMVRLWNREYCEEVRTSLAGSTDFRISNVKKACDILNGMMLMPGETFSYNDALGERLDTLGWLPAPAYANGEVRQEYGGGICQVSSTLYNAVLYANLEIVERTCHQFQVGYLPWGMDATVSWGWPDFKFRNDKEYPIMIVAWVDDDTRECCVQIKGTDTEHQYVMMRFANWEFYDNTDTYHDASGNPLAMGMEASTWRQVFNDGDDWATATPVSETYEAYSKYNYHTEDIEARNVPLAGAPETPAEGGET